MQESTGRSKSTKRFSTITAQYVGKEGFIKQFMKYVPSSRSQGTFQE